MALENLLASHNPVYNPDDLKRYREDWSGICGGLPTAVVRPSSIEEIATIAAACHRLGVRITVQGGLTGLAGGAVPDDGDVVLSLERLNRIQEIDTLGGTVVAEAGVVLEKLCEAVEALDWYFPLDCGARGSCQIGGNVATNAGGNRVLRYGTMRDLVLGLEVVLPDGTVLSMLNRVIKDNTGLDLKHLFIGSEGTLGIVSRVVLKLFPKPQRRHAALCAFDSFAQMTSLLKSARAALPTLSAFEVMWLDYLEAASRAVNRVLPFDGQHPLYALLEIESFEAEDDSPLESFLYRMLECGLTTDVILPQSEQQAASLWQLRDAIGEILPRLHPFVAFDVGVPLSAMEAFVDEVATRLRNTYPDAEHLFFGHLGDGNLHLATGPYSDNDIEAVETLVYSAVSARGGSISAEHGIGRVKKPFLGYSRSDAQLAVMRTVKEAIDAKGVLNVGRILD
ncbi:FAD-binding oxidoreductase [Thauera sp.]|uniref:FAD-binding oxidoreductase n=1 Tax=Thauera sp. TaxID=1905334 RepID=UPI002B6106BA|nr:FAD-binding oxidoreductase [Thauera sp.]HRO37103.1 FAD-binding oxidoreductase [Thauera sp.]